MLEDLKLHALKDLPLQAHFLALSHRRCERNDLGPSTELQELAWVCEDEVVALVDQDQRAGPRMEVDIGVVLNFAATGNERPEILVVLLFLPLQQRVGEDNMHSLDAALELQRQQCDGGDDSALACTAW